MGWAWRAFLYGDLRSITILICRWRQGKSDVESQSDVGMCTPKQKAQKWVGGTLTVSDTLIVINIPQCEALQGGITPLTRAHNYIPVITSSPASKRPHLAAASAQVQRRGPPVGRIPRHFACAHDRPAFGRMLQPENHRCQHRWSALQKQLSRILQVCDASPLQPTWGQIRPNDAAEQTKPFVNWRWPKEKAELQIVRLMIPFFPTGGSPNKHKAKICCMAVWRRIVYSEQLW